ncbi:MAG: YggT family protein, partial [Gemmatimonadaceae bacterium]
GIAYASQFGSRGVLRLLVSWTFTILRMAIVVRVISSWVRISPYSPWVRWAFVLSEPILRPLRQIVPMLGMIDISPIVAYLLLGLLERLVVGFM